MVHNTAKKPETLWRRFIALSLLCALLPGFGLAVLMTSAWGFGIPRGTWYAAATQVHAVSLLAGWGGAMILGVGLHFLPRLRGVKLAAPGAAAALFWLLLLGIAGRVCGQLTLAVAPHSDSILALLLNAFVAGGVLLQTFAVVGLLTILITTFRSGKPLRENKGFQQIAPLLLVAALGLLFAQFAWCQGAFTGWSSGLATLPPASQEAGVDLMLFGFVMAMGIGMSARLFPLTFRTHQAPAAGLQITAILLALGLLLTLLSRPAFAASFFGLGILTGTFSSRIFHRRKVIPHSQIVYRMREDPAAVGVACAFLWAVMAAGLLLLFTLGKFGVPLPALLIQKNLARHALGAGFMTLLILSVGWKMLPGFGGCLPSGRGFLWCAVILGNTSVTLRLVSALVFGDGGFEKSPAGYLLPMAGLAAFAAILAFLLALRASYRSKKHRTPESTTPSAASPPRSTSPESTADRKP